jgi:hypothetical protein
MSGFPRSKEETNTLKEFGSLQREKEKRTRGSTVVAASIHQSLATSQFHGAARSLVTSRHPGAACHPAPPTTWMVTIITVWISQQGRRNRSLFHLWERNPQSASLLSLYFDPVFLGGTREFVPCVNANHAVPIERDKRKTQQKYASKVTLRHAWICVT